MEGKVLTMSIRSEINRAGSRFNAYKKELEEQRADGTITEEENWDKYTIVEKNTANEIECLEEAEEENNE